MTAMTLSPDLAGRLEKLRAEGYRVFGPGPMTPGETTPTPDTRVPLPGVHLQIADPRGSLIDGYGADADEAALNALSKLRR
jgi:hypothetical protein